MPALSLFYSYSHKDELLRQKLETHLSLLQREGLIQPWHDRCIRPGTEWANQIDDHIRSADIILLLISPDFLASNYCFDIEMKVALERHEAHQARVVPIILRPVDWHTSPFGKLQSVPRDGKPVTKFADRDRAFAGIARELRALVTQNERNPHTNLADAAARDKYLSWVATQHRYIRFSGMAVVDERAEVEMAKVFVMPRLLPQSRGVADEKDSAGIPVNEILSNLNDANRLVILGGPGSGKTTLLESLALAFARPDTFTWSQQLPNLLPVFYRVRDLDKDLQEHGGSIIWDCITHRICRGMQDDKGLPAGFFQRQMHASGLAILFDGLDEAGSLARRNEIVNLIGAFAAQLPAQCRLIVTSRPHDYRNRFDEASWQNLHLAEFDDSEIQAFIANWQKIHQTDRLPGKDLWPALESRPDILALARRALMLTIVVRLHFGLAALPDSRLGLYEKCTETLLKHWADAKGLDESPIDTAQKRKLLQKLAYEMQGEAERLDPNMTLQISRSELVHRFTAYLKEDGGPYQQVDKVIERLDARDAILVNYGTDKTGQAYFGFVSRSFQEYFAAGWLANEIAEEEFRDQLLTPRDGWTETLCLAVGQLRPDMRRRKTLLDLLQLGRAAFAVDCLRAAAAEQPWLRLLVQFLGKYTPGGRAYLDLGAAECAAACSERPETMTVLRALLQRKNPDRQALVAGVELAEELGRSGNEEAQALARGWKHHPEILSMLKEQVRLPDVNLRLAALQELARGWKDDPETLAITRECARFDSESTVRKAAVKELARVWRDDPDTLPTLKALALNDSDSAVRSAAIEALASRWAGESNVLDFLIQSASADGATPVRIAALEGLALGWRNAPRAFDQLRTQAEDRSNDDLRAIAVRELARYYSTAPEVRELLLASLQYDQSAAVRCESALGFAKGPWDAPTRSVLISVGKSDDDPRVRERIQTAIESNPSIWKSWLTGVIPEDQMPPQPFHLEIGSVRLQNVRMFRDVYLEFEPGDALIVGDNASGKTTLLRAIAIALLGRDLALKIEPRPASYVRRGADRATIEVLFRLYGDAEPTHLTDEFLVGLEIRRGETSFSASEPIGDNRESRNCLGRLGVIRRKDARGRNGFLCAYGSKRTFADPSQPKVPMRDDAVVDRVVSLFDPQAPVIDPDRVSKLLAGNLMIGHDVPSTTPVSALISIQKCLRTMLPQFDVAKDAATGGDGTYSNAEDLRDLSDGYASLLAVSGHVFQHAMGARDWAGDPAEVRGVMLIDEVDAHLHPKWQRRILSDLRTAFPNLQIIATSHSAMVAGSVEPRAIRLLKRSGDEVDVGDTPSVEGWRADQILTSELFDLPTTRNTKIEALFREYADKLADFGPDDPEVRRLGAIVSEALEIDGEGAVERTTHEFLKQFLLNRFSGLNEETRRLVLARAGLVLGSKA